ncbi:MAG: VWA domain-containing protein [Phaeodactylibacter sp.]|uniref:vWA domain-containing protein n=1 Tax=Phaeodactylibacter sp. TaxID=1940289 RepID=UPI0032EF45FD
MKNLKIAALLSLAAVLAFASCKKEENDTPTSNVDEIPEPGCIGVTSDDAIVLRFDYTYYQGEEPQVEIVRTRTDERVQYDTTVFFPTVEDNKVVIRIPNIRLSDNDFNYTAQCVTIEERDDTRPANDRWFEQTEFKNQEEFAQTRMATQLVVDVSSSLGEDRDKVKQYALNFAEQILTSNGGSGYIGLTLFADTVITYPFTTQLSDVATAINNFPYPDLNAQTFTRLSDGILSGLNALGEADLDVDDKVLVAFTDGNDNGSNNPTGNRQQIQASDFPRYMIGLKGKGLEYNTNYLKSLASSENFFVEAEDANELQERFNDINELIANIYTVIYNRSTQTFNPDIDEPISLRAIFYALPYEIDQN